jgi:hypothetical protein
LNFGVLGVLRVWTLEFLCHFTKNSCTKIDIEFHELGLMLNAKNEHVVKWQWSSMFPYDFKTMQRI